MQEVPQNAKKTSPTCPKNKRTRLIWIPVSAALIIPVAIVAFKAFSPSDPGRSAPASIPRPGILADDANRLLGNWVRTDTPYVIEIIDANDSGALKAAYYNPRSINVAHAEARYTAGNLEVFVELRDINYPGSTYTLTYDRQNDILRGVYFQATMRETYDVAFTRERSNP